ncbi:MAG: shikimate kinase [Candidatus Zixiibacteriota bacterium]
MLPNVNIVLAGPMGSGKTSVGEVVASKLGREFRDTDRMIEEITGLSIVRIFSERSETYFRSMEREVAKVIAHHKNFVVAVGGGMTVPEENFLTLSASGLIICLTASQKVLANRLSDHSGRPMLEGHDLKTRLPEILRERRKAYNRIPFLIETDGLEIESVAERVIILYQEQTAGV